MGCFWSCDADGYPVDREVYQRPYATGRLNTTTDKAYFGEYTCSGCGHNWNSRLSYKEFYQICKRCKRHVYPRFQRELRPSDISHDKNIQEHPKELCQRCQQLGQYCGNDRKGKISTAQSRNCTKNNYNGGQNKFFSAHDFGKRNSRNNFGNNRRKRY